MLPSVECLHACVSGACGHGCNVAGRLIFPLPMLRQSFYRSKEFLLLPLVKSPWKVREKAMNYRESCK